MAVKLRIKQMIKSGLFSPPFFKEGWPDHQIIFVQKAIPAGVVGTARGFKGSE